MNFSSIEKLIRSVEEIAWYLFLVMLALQTRHIFGFQPWGFIEWNAISLYLTDILFLILVLLWARHARLRLGALTLIDLGAVLLIVTAGISIFGSTHRDVSLFQWVKLVEGILLFWYVRHYALRRFSHIRSLEAFLLGSLVQAGIAVAQFVRQADGGLWFLGESILSPYLKGIASFYISENEKVIRAYGTTPHPNILATYLAVAIFGYWYYFLRVLRHRWASAVSLAGYALIVFGFLMTFSRTVIFAWAAASLVLWAVVLLRSNLRNILFEQRQRLLVLAAVTALLLALFAGVYRQEIVARFTIAADDEALSLRLYYGKQAFRTGSGGLNWNGVGIGNFVNWFMESVPTLPRYLYQPVHNVYLLAYSETGILGIGAFLVLLAAILWRFIRHRYSDMLLWLTVGASVAILLFVGVFDHFSWTLQQGRMLLWLILGVAAGHLEKNA